MPTLKAFGRYLFNLIYLLDLALNALTGGDPRETLSARMGRDIAAGRCKACGVICWVLGRIQKDHCAKSAAGENRPFAPDMQVSGD